MRLAIACYAYTSASLQEYLAEDFALAALAVVAFAFVAALAAAKLVPCAVAGLN